MESNRIDLLRAAPPDEPALADLLQLYAQEFSAFHPVQFGRDGRFVYRDLPNYWREPSKHPFLIEIGGETAGFVLVQQPRAASGDDVVWDIAECFVLNKFRRRGVGMDVAHRIWRRLPGMWQVRVLQENNAAIHFWDQAILRFTGKPAQWTAIDREGDRWRVFSLESRNPG